MPAIDGTWTAGHCRRLRLRLCTPPTACSLSTTHTLLSASQIQIIRHSVVLRRGKHVPGFLSGEPVFIEAVDVRKWTFRTSLRLGGDEAQPSSQRHSHLWNAQSDLRLVLITPTVITISQPGWREQTEDRCGVPVTIGASNHRDCSAACLSICQ